MRLINAEPRTRGSWAELKRDRGIFG